MKFNVPSKTLYTYASAVSKVINSKNALTVLNNFLMTLEGDTLTITGSDIENALTARVPVTEAEGSGSFCVEARRLTDLLKEIPDQGVRVEVDGSYKVKVSYSSGSYDFVALDGAEYPSYKKEDENTEPIHFHDVVYSVVSDCTESGMLGNLSFAYDIPLNCRINGNFNLLTGMLSNLVKNANIHSKGTECGIKLVGEDDIFYTFAFYDNGIGVSQ